MTEAEKKLAQASMMDAFTVLGGGTASKGRKVVADRCGVDHTTTYNWSVIPAKYVLIVEAISGVPRSYLRHDLYPGKGVVGEAPNL